METLLDGGNDRWRRTGVCWSPEVAGLGKMMKHHTGAPCSGGALQTVYPQCYYDLASRPAKDSTQNAKHVPTMIKQEQQPMRHELAYVPQAQRLRSQEARGRARGRSRGGGCTQLMEVGHSSKIHININKLKASHKDQLPQQPKAAIPPLTSYASLAAGSKVAINLDVLKGADTTTRNQPLPRIKVNVGNLWNLHTQANDEAKTHCVY
ncbi:hypothetical protein ACLOJK_034404, partial [Asimina triloba]